MKNIVTGFVAHVDAGKTTLSESLLYITHTTRHQGRVDHKDTLLDFDQQERDRGITIFSKISNINYLDTHFTFLDTPGHVDFSGEMERALSVLDYAILIVSGIDGLQAHTKTIWKLLSHYRIPTFIFVNKMDISPYTKHELLDNLRELSDNIIDIEKMNYEEMAMADDALLEEYMQTNALSKESLAKAIQERKLFPVIFGSALKNDHVQELLDMLDTYTIPHSTQNELSASVYKIDHDDKGERLTYVRIYDGMLHVKQLINEEKINQIRLYQGNKYTLLEEAGAGSVVVLTGLKETQSGDIIGRGKPHTSYLQPYMHYQLHLADNENQSKMLENLKLLAQEEPLLNMKIQDAQHIEVSLMGEIQIEILKEIIRERYHEEVTIDSKQISYKETILDSVEGVGHFEPLRHYAEVHILLEPLPTGSGIEYENRCMNNLPENYQRLIMTHLQEKVHLGVLTGSPLTDIRFVLLGGKAHDKHTVGGDFREATYRAVRHALMRTTSILLEPYGKYVLKIPSAFISKAFYDLDSEQPPIITDDNGTTATIKGQAPIEMLSNYTQEVLNYTKGEGSLSIEETYYAPVKEPEEIIEQFHYNPEQDLENPTGSIFCTHGAGYYVPWQMVEEKMHLDYFIKEEKETAPITHRKIHISDEEVKRVFENTYGKQERKLAKDFYGSKKKEHTPTTVSSNTYQQKPECLLVDGYNVIFAWDELNKIAKTNLGAARDKLLDIMSSYQGYRDNTVIVVFDAYKVPGNPGSKTQYHNLYVVYTKEQQTADAYIEKTTKEIANHYRVVVATSDNAEQTIVVGHGATRVSSRELKELVEHTNAYEQAEYHRKNPIVPDTPLDHLKKD